MIDEVEIEQKDFSGAICRVIARLNTLGGLLSLVAFHDLSEFGTSPEDFKGISSIIQDAAYDLQIIYDGLYEDEIQKKAPETKPRKKAGPGLSG